VNERTGFAVRGLVNLRLTSFCLLLLLTSCVWRSEEYRQFYAHLQRPRAFWRPMQEDEYFLVILVDARHLDYTQTDKFLHSVAKHPSDGSKTRDVGHAWIYLQGKWQGQRLIIEGGHSGEREEYPPRYFDGLMNYHEEGYANPIEYLWTVREDGFFQKGSGGHRPTFAAKVSLTQGQFYRILRFIHPRYYPYQHYSLLGPQCSSFVTQVAALAGLNLSSHVTMHLAPRVCYGGRIIRLWQDPHYATITFSTPDVIEKSLMNAVKEGKAEYALDWYLNK
jgi:hypothetical protein